MENAFYHLPVLHSFPALGYHQYLSICKHTTLPPTAP